MATKSPEAALEGSQSKIDAQLYQQFAKMSQNERNQIARIMNPAFIYSPEEAALRYTMLMLATPSRIKSILHDVNQQFAKPNRATRRIVISNARRAGRRKLRAERRQRTLPIAA